MYKYLIVICSVLVLAGCAGGSSVPADQEIENPSVDGSLLGGGSDVDDGDDIIDAGSSGGSSTTYTSTDDEDDAELVVKVLKRKYETSLFGAIDINLRVKGGSGNYTWVADWLPPGLSFQDQAGKNIHIKGQVGAIGTFSGIVKVCDAETPTNCGEKDGFEIEVKDNRKDVSETQIAFLGCQPFEIVQVGNPANPLKEDRPNAYEPHRPSADPFTATFEAKGGTGPFKWTFSARTEEGSGAMAVGAEFVSAWNPTPSSDTRQLVVSSTLDRSIFTCEDEDGNPVFSPDGAVKCEGTKKYTEEITVKVEDLSCLGFGSAEKKYNFDLTPTDRMTMKKLKMAIKVNLGDTCETCSCEGPQWIRLRLYDSTEKFPLISADFQKENYNYGYGWGDGCHIVKLPQEYDSTSIEDGWRPRSWSYDKMGSLIEDGAEDLDATEGRIFELHAHDTNGDGAWMDVNLEWAVIFNDFWYLVTPGTNLEVQDDEEVARLLDLSKIPGGDYLNWHKCSEINQDPNRAWLVERGVCNLRPMGQSEYAGMDQSCESH